MIADGVVHLCGRCGRDIHEQEASICAFCRMEHRGDDTLLSHCRDGWHDEPCGCGTCELTLADLAPLPPPGDVDRDELVCAECGAPAEFKVAGIRYCAEHERKAA